MYEDGPDACRAYLDRFGVAAPAPRTRPFDPGYDPATVEAHFRQSGHVMAMYKLSVGWLVAREAEVRRKIEAARACGVATVTGGGPFEIAAVFGQLPAYLDLCASLGVTRVECGEGFTETGLVPGDVLEMAGERGLEVEVELGKKHGGAFTQSDVAALVDEGRAWLEAGAKAIVVEARESARAVGLFDVDGRLDEVFADRFVDGLGLANVVFEAPNKPSQFAFLDHLGPEVQLSNIRFEELLRVEAYRRGLHSDAFVKGRLRPTGVPR